MILVNLLRRCLQPGKILLNKYGKVARRAKHKERSQYDKPDLSILLALNKKLVEYWKDMLYQGNIFVMPHGYIEYAFFRHWGSRDLRLLPSVELRIDRDDFVIVPNKSSRHLHFKIPSEWCFEGTDCRRYLLQI